VKQTFSPKNQKIIEQLEGLKSIKFKYPSKLLNNRRTAFIRQIEDRERIESKEVTLLDNNNQDITSFLKSLGSVRTEYPPQLLARRRLIFKLQLIRESIALDTLLPPESLIGDSAENKIFNKGRMSLHPTRLCIIHTLSILYLPFIYPLSTYHLTLVFVTVIGKSGKKG
jgi:hypothetical protein